MKRKISKKVPRLVSETMEFIEEVDKPMYLDEMESIEVMVEYVSRNDVECNILLRKMKSIREY